ncbi:MAG: PD-(D/E)XK nuclease family protein [Bacteroidales bacterium]|jgi:hypothetical protein|nr:PD-(D/E)XK nuclease family protein [Bacteroidales bacterium]
MGNFETLLKKVRQITDKYEEIAYLKGENFNLFDILDRRSDEVKSHSAMLAELLNPKGSHGMKDKFLKLFIEMLNGKLDPNIHYNKNNDFTSISIENLEDTKPLVEFNIGDISEDKSGGGRIDILLTNKDYNICIENKIYADDQDYQLRRYYNYLNKETSKNNILIYLTLDGKEASEKSTKKSGENGDKDLLSNDKDYFCLSYKKDILSWLQNCYHASIELPILRESIKQYIILIKSLTNQLTSDKMAEEVHKTILIDIKSAENIAKEFDNAIKECSNKLKENIKKKLEVELPDAFIEMKENNSFSSIFIWFEKEKLHVGIESFSSKSLKQNNAHIFIGQMDWRGKESGKDIVNGIWIKDKFTPICNKEEFFNKLQDFSHSNVKIQNEVVDFFVAKIKSYIDITRKK